MNYVKFLRGTPTAFAKLESKDLNTLYFISESDANVGQLYLGNKLISGNSGATTINIADIADVVINSTTLADGAILAFDWASQKWVNKTIEEIQVDVMTGASATMAGAAGLVPTPAAGDQGKFLRGDGTWVDNPGMTAEQAQTLEDLDETVEALLGNSVPEGAAVPSIKNIALDALKEALIPADAKESLDTLQEIAAWIQDHPDSVGTINADIAALKKTVNGEAATNTKGLVEKVSDLETAVGNINLNNYVTTATYSSEVGDLQNLNFSLTSNTTIVQEINSINEKLTWVDMAEE